MTNKVELNTLTQVVHKEQAFLTALNENFLRLQQAINDTLSRTGVVPNEMEEVLDMNGKRIINVGAAVEDTDALTRGFIQDLIGQVEAAVARLTTLVQQAKEELALYAAEYILPPAIAARDDAIAAKNAAKEYYDDTKALYDKLIVLVNNLNALLAVADSLTSINSVAGDLTNIDTLAAISSDITTISSNIAAILAAPTYASNAQTWAEGTDVDVAALGGTHSAKKWAELSAQDYSLSLKNTATGTDSLTILGTASSTNSTLNVGVGSAVTQAHSTALGVNATAAYAGTSVGKGAQSSEGVAVGMEASANYTYAVAVGYSAVAGAAGAIQLGKGTNSTANTLQVGLEYNNVQVQYPLLTADGLIPYQRLPISSSVDSSSTNETCVGSKLFYDTCGDIETLINAL